MIIYRLAQHIFYPSRITLVRNTVLEINSLVLSLLFDHNSALEKLELGVTIITVRAQAQHTTRLEEYLKTVHHRFLQIRHTPCFFGDQPVKFVSWVNVFRASLIGGEGVPPHIIFCLLSTQGSWKSILIYFLWIGWRVTKREYQTLLNIFNFVLLILLEVCCW